MTFYHFMNCALLLVGPFFVLYSGTCLSEERALFVFRPAFFKYVGIQLCKMMLLAVLLPAQSGSLGDQQDGAEGEGVVLEQFLGVLDRVVDVVGLYICVYTSREKAAAMRALSIGGGWALADAVFSKVLPLWVGARGVEFDWKYLLLASNASVALLRAIAITVLVGVYMMHTEPSAEAEDAGAGSSGSGKRKEAQGGAVDEGSFEDAIAAIRASGGGASKAKLSSKAKKAAKAKAKAKQLEELRRQQKQQQADPMSEEERSSQAARKQMRVFVLVVLVLVVVCDGLIGMLLQKVLLPGEVLATSSSGLHAWTRAAVAALPTAASVGVAWSLRDKQRDEQKEE